MINCEPSYALMILGSFFVKTLEANWKIIRDEGLAVMDKAKGLFVPEDENLREKGDWSQYTLWQQGKLKIKMLIKWIFMHMW